MTAQKTVKYTVVLPCEYIDELKHMSECDLISSVNQGIRQAVERFIEGERAARYGREMRAAASDPDFIARMTETQEAFADVDAAEMETW